MLFSRQPLALLRRASTGDLHESPRESFLPGPTQGITSETRFGTPGLASEITYTRGDHKFAIGFGAYTIFGFQSKLKDPPEPGPLATFFDTRVASNDFTAGGAVKLHPIAREKARCGHREK